MTEMVYLYGDSGVGKTALTLSVLEKIKEVGKNYRKEVVITRAVSSESEQLVPLRYVQDVNLFYFAVMVRGLALIFN
jgi:Cdc6-like AAA superfamily ATPase